MKDNFVNIHVHSTYSFLDGLGHPQQYAERAAELGQIGLGVTDHGNVSSHYKWNKECKKRGLTPILGCELYIQSSENDFKNYEHMTCLAINNEGYSNLLKIVTEGWSRGGKHPIVPLEFVLKHQKGLVLTSGCPSGRLIKMLVSGQDAEAEKYLRRMNNLIEHFYIEVSPWNFISDKGVDFRPFVIQMKKLSKKLKIPLVATSDCHYVREGQDKVQEILLCIQRGDKMSNQNRWKFDLDNLYLKSREEMERDFKLITKVDFSEALDNTVKIAKMVDFTFPTASALKIDTGLENKIDVFKRLVWNGMKKKKLHENKIYLDRVKYEVDLILKKGFVDYFLIVSDMCQWAKNNNILVGPARGSAAGSLVCYLIRITEVDPIKYGLMFERFIDINREDFPDIDVDFEDERRQEVIKHLEEKYGEDKVCHIATFATFKGRNTIQDFGKAYEMPMKLTSDLSALIIERSGGDSRASFTIMDSLQQFDLAKNALKLYPDLKYASEIEGQMKNLSSHASGILITNEPLENFCAIYRVSDDEKRKNQKTSSMDYYDASGMGLMKLDVLGLNTLTAVHKAINMIQKNHGVTIDLYNMDLEDPGVYAGFRNEKKLFGIFQFDGQAVNQVCRQINPTCFEDLSAINALSRPGPMHGMDLELQKPVTTIFIERKNGKIPMGTAHPLLKNITGDTQGVVIYQEQVMKVMREIGLMSWKDTADIRKNISRSRGVEAFNEFKVKFAEGATKNGLNEHEIDNIWGAVCTFGCLSGDAVLELPQSNQHSPKTITIKELFRNNGAAKIATDKGNRYAQRNRKVKLLCMKGNSIQTDRICDIYESGIKTTFKVETESGETIRSTMDHLFYTPNGYKKLEELHLGDLVAIKGEKFPSKKNKGTGSGAHNIRHGQSKLFLEKQRFLRKKYKLCQVCFVNNNEETHHKDRDRMNNEWSNLVPICRKCHKKTYPISIPFQKGFQVKFSKISAIWSPKKEMTYDIAMPFPYNNYVANDFVVHNSWAFNKSHSISYSIISYWTMFLKVYYPIEYYCSMASTMNMESKVRRVIKEYHREGYKLLPLDINKSKESFAIDEGLLRLGFSQIKGIGDSVAQKIVQNQPYKNIADFEFKMGIKSKKSKVVSLLAKMGAFDNAGGVNYKIHTLFEVIEDNRFSPANEEERMNICPLSIDFNFMEEWKPIISNYIKQPLNRIELLNPQAESQLIAGVMYDKNLKDKIEEALTRGKTAPLIKNGQSKYCNFILEDDTDFVTCRIAPANFEKFKTLIFEDTKPSDVLLIKGKMGDGIRMFFVNEVINLRIFKERLKNQTKDYTESELILTGQIEAPKRWRNSY